VPVLRRKNGTIGLVLVIFIIFLPTGISGSLRGLFVRRRATTPAPARA